MTPNSDLSDAERWIVDHGDIYPKPIPGAPYAIRQQRLDTINEIIKHGEGLFDEWTGLSTKKPPENLFERVLWTFGVIGQLILSTVTFPAALAAFLMEEAIQSYGMGAYILWQSDDYITLIGYLQSYKDYMDVIEFGAKTAATINPITGGAVLLYMEAARANLEAFQQATLTKIYKMAETDKAIRDKILEQSLYGEVRLQSIPSDAEIWVDGLNTELLTPETFKMLPVGPTVFEVRKWNTKTEQFDILIFEIEIEAGIRKEILANIKTGIAGEEEEGKDTDTEEEPILPTWIKAEVTGNYSIDGDTFVTTTGERIRIMGIDAPEVGRPWATIATDYLNEQIADKKINLEILSATPLDVYGRTLAVCKNYKGNIGIMLLSAGLARVDILEDSLLDRVRYDSAEQLAKQRQIGIWGAMPPTEDIPPEEPVMPIGLEDYLEEVIKPVMLDAYVEAASAITGDTFITDEDEIIHILGISAPVIGGYLFEESLNSLNEYIEGKRIHLYIQSNRMLDEIGNTLAIAKVGAINLAIEQLRDGLAYQRTLISDIYDTREYIEHERLARAREIGIWSVLS